MKTLRLASVGFVLLSAMVGCTQPTSASVDPPVAQSVSVGLADWTNDATNQSFSASYYKAPLTDAGRARQVSLSLALPAGYQEITYLLTNTSTAPSAWASLANLSVSRSSAEVSPRAVESNAPLGPLVRRELPHLNEATKVAAAKARSSRSAVSASVDLGPWTVDSSQISFVDALWADGTNGAAPQAINVHQVKLRKQVTNGDRTLNVWVSNKAWDSNSDGSPDIPSTGLTHGVTQTMVDQLAAKFLTSGTDDIYHWVTSILGPEWPSSGAPALPGETTVASGGNIHIFLVNLNPGGTANGTLMGYFHALNNFAGYQGSNEKVLFALNADSLANPDDDGNPNTSDSGSWSLGDYWPAEVVSTLAHEFQHMVHFYQKQVRNQLSESTDTWVDEMASQVIEDLVAQRLSVAGPRGVVGTLNTGTSGLTSGRIPLFNYYHELVPLTGWNYDSSLPHYSTTYAFGAWALRNYGGPAFLRRLVQSPYVDQTAVVDAVQTVGQVSATFPSLVRDWGLATYLGGSTGSTLRYRSGLPGQTWSLDGVSHTVGDLNLWYYRQLDLDSSLGVLGPYVYGGIGSDTSVAPGATLFLSAGAGTVSAGQIVQDSLTLPPNVVLTVVRRGL